MTKSEAQRRDAQRTALMSLGFSAHEAEALRRISRTLHRWHELECGVDGGCIERDEVTGRPYWLSSWTGKRSRSPVADRERGALRRLQAIVGLCDARKGAHSSWAALRSETLHYYVQTDPRGAALYILRPGDVPAGADVSSCYARGLCVY